MLLHFVTIAGKKVNQLTIKSTLSIFSAIQGFKSPSLLPLDATKCSQLHTKDTLRHIIYTAETHNFPTGVCPFPGAGL
jgi:phosphoribosylformylglycinamidine (FGAM) synthase-like enzyme